MFYSSGSKDLTNVEPICKFFVSGCWWTVKESKLSQILRWGGGGGGGVSVMDWHYMIGK